VEEEKMKKRILAMMCVLTMLTVTFVGCSKTEQSNQPAESNNASNAESSNDTITFKLALVDPDSSPYAQGAHAIAEEVEKATDGKIKIEVNAGGALGGERDTIELAMSNNLDIATCANSVLANFIPEMGILDQAYLWKNSDEAHAAVDGPVGDLIEEEAEKLGLHVIGYMESGFRNTFSTKPIESIDDFKGVTIRTMENKYHQAAFKSFGAMPVAMAYNDVFTALQQRTIDACENATANCWNSGFYEVTKHITNTQHAFVYILLCMSDEAWNKIPEDLRDTFLEAVHKGVETERELLVQANEEATEKLKAEGVEFHDIDIAELQAKYKEEAKKEGFTFDPKWQAAVDEAIASCN
jgi:TRAP-type transport system periplasmic protein